LAFVAEKVAVETQSFIGARTLPKLYFDAIAAGKRRRNVIEII
jgi:hypothetical protein